MDKLRRINGYLIKDSTRVRHVNFVNNGVFKKEFPTNDSFVIPGHREPFRDAGKAKGGLAQLSSKVL